MLIDSPRLSDADRQAWAIAECGDLRRGRSLDGRIRAARDAIAAFVRARPEAFVSVSWGKDSVVVAHLARSVDPTMPLGHETRGEWESPEVHQVRDAYLAQWPMPYMEVRFDPVVCADGYVRNRGKYRGLNEAMGPYRISGVRAAESGMRSLSARVHGVATAETCRPILHWSTAEVFAYLARFDLPVHPAYAMTMGGTLDRERLRVAPLFGDRGAERGRRAWEEHYYPDHAERLRAILRRISE